MNKCKICDCNLDNIFKLSMHLIKEHKIKSKEYYDKYLKQYNDDKCHTCGQQTNFLNLSLGYRKYCSRKCTSNSDTRRISLNDFYKDKNNIKLRQQKVKNTLLQKYGVDNPMLVPKFREKLKNTFQSKYGVNSPFENIDIRKRAKQTILQKYGTEFASQNNDIKEKQKQTFLKKYGINHPLLDRPKMETIFMERYGFKNPSSSPQVIEKRKQTFLERYGVNNPSKIQRIKDKIKFILLKKYYQNIQDNFKYKPLFTFEEYKGSLENYKWQCKKCNYSFESRFQCGYTLHCPKCEPNPKSCCQQELFIFLSKYFSNISQNNRTILDNKFELDIFILSKNLAIEFNGNYWHSEINGNKNYDYHLNKTELCQNKNIRLIHIFEDEWLFKEKIVKNRLKNILGLTKYNLYARKCIIKEIDTQLKDKFLNKYHIQGSDKSKIKLGLFYKNRLVSVMTFSKLRIALGQTNTLNEWELSRFASINNFNIVGGGSKLLKYFERNYKPIKIISYADRRWSQGNLYYKIGFNLDHISKPNYWYLQERHFLKRLHRFNFRKDRLPLLLEKFDPLQTEWANMKNNGYDRIWDCGNMVFKWAQLVS